MSAAPFFFLPIDDTEELEGVPEKYLFSKITDSSWPNRTRHIMKNTGIIPY
jgi:hypothetical protein